MLLQRQSSSLALFALFLGLVALRCNATDDVRCASSCDRDQSDILPGHALGRLGSDRLKPGAAVTYLNYSHDGTLVVSATARGIQFWESASGNLKASLPGKHHKLGFAAQSPDERTMVVYSFADLCVLGLDAETGETRLRFKESEAAHKFAAFSRDGRDLALAGEDVVLLYDGRSGQLAGKLSVGHGRDDNIKGLAFSPDGLTLVTAHDGTDLRCWDVKERKELRRFGPKGATCVAFSPDGKAIATATFSDPSIVLWRVESGEMMRRFKGHSTSTVALSFSPDGRTVAAGSLGGTIRLWDVESGQELQCLSGHHGLVGQLAFSPDGKMLASGGKDATIRLWDVASGEARLAARGHNGAVNSIAVSPDGETLASGGDDQAVRFWDGRSFRMIQDLATAGSVRAVSYSPRGDVVAFAGSHGTLGVWESKTEVRWDAKDSESLYNSLTWVNTGRTLVCGEYHGVECWDTVTHKRDKLLTLIGDAAGSSDGRLLAVWANQEIRVWDMAAEKQCFKHPLMTDDGGSDEATCAAFSPDDSVLVCATQYGSINLLDATNGQRIVTTPAGKHFPMSIAFSPDARLLASGGGDETVRLWELATGREVCALRGHRGTVNCVAFFPDGRRLASGAGDTTVLIWDWCTREDGDTLDLGDAAARNRAWDDLADADAKTAFRVVRVLIAAGDEGVGFLHDHLHPLPSPERQRLDRLVADLDSQDFDTREKAEKDLRQLGRVAEPWLRRTATGDSVEARRRAAELLAAIRPWVNLDAEERQAGRAVLVLEQIGTPKARELLERLAAGAEGAWLTREAHAALDRVAKRPAVH
jgi:WD40 repeat protein